MKPLSSVVTLIILGVGILSAGCGCGNRSGGGAAPPPTVANVTLSVKFGPYTDPGTKPCTGRVSWRLTPLQLTGTTGTRTQQVIEKDYSANTQSVGAGQWACFFNESVSGLAVGTWRIEAQTPVWSTSCEKEFTAGANLIHFAEHRPDCIKGTSYPGD